MVIIQGMTHLAHSSFVLSSVNQHQNFSLLSSRLLPSSLVHYVTMASATTIQPVGPVCTLGSHAFPKHSRPSKAEIQSRTNDFSPTKWSYLLRTGFLAMKEYTHRTYEEQSSSMPAEVVEYGLFAPRRKHAGEKKTQMALQTAKLLYPAPEDAELSQIIKYGERAPRDRIIWVTANDLTENDVVALRQIIKSLVQAEADAAIRTAQEGHNVWAQRIKDQGPWDEINDPLPLTGASSLPMPVTISDAQSLEPFFAFLSSDDVDSKAHERILSTPKQDKEEVYAVDVGVWEKGMLYADGRMDLCKQYASSLLLLTHIPPSSITP